MTHPRRFRFGVQGRTTGPREPWLAMVYRVEDLGYSSFLALDHFVRGFDPVASLMAAAIAAPGLRVGSFMFDNDFRHPALLAKAAASLDVLSGGRLELGIGAGWLREEYDQTGIPFDPAGVRIARMTEAVHLMKRIWTEEHPVSFAGDYYTVTGLLCPPAPVQRPHPPFMIGGGSRRILSVAAVEADIVGITTRALPDGSKDWADMTAAATERKIGWVREAAGARFADIELNISMSDVIVTGDRAGEADRLAARYGVTQEAVLESPQVLIGSPEEMAEQLQERRERYGFSYIVVTEPYLEEMAPVVARLANQ
jgi:probable F420-dependent oxidoreductase